MDRRPSFHSFVEKQNYCGRLYDDHNVLGDDAGGGHNYRNYDNNHGIHLYNHHNFRPDRRHNFHNCDDQTDAYSFLALVHLLSFHTFYRQFRGIFLEFVLYR